jgi:hypothetical protein
MIVTWLKDAGDLEGAGDGRDRVNRHVEVGHDEPALHALRAREPGRGDVEDGLLTVDDGGRRGRHRDRVHEAGLAVLRSRHDIRQPPVEVPPQRAIRRGATDLEPCERGVEVPAALVDRVHDHLRPLWRPPFPHRRLPHAAKHT